MNCDLDKLSHRHQTVEVNMSLGPDKRGRFQCIVNGGIEYWTKERIVQAIEDGDAVRERK